MYVCATPSGVPPVTICRASGVGIAFRWSSVAESRTDQRYSVPIGIIGLLSVRLAHALTLSVVSLVIELTVLIACALYCGLSVLGRIFAVMLGGSPSSGAGVS